MRRLCAGSLAISAMLLAGCGASAPAVPNLSSNWIMTAQPASGAALHLAGSLTRNGRWVAGVLHILDSHCFALPAAGSNGVADLFVAGVAQEDGSLALTSEPFNGQVLSIEGTLSSNGSALQNGAFGIAGGCADHLSGSLTGTHIADLTGRYSASNINLTAPQPAYLRSRVSVVMDLKQNTTPLSNGVFSLSGDVAITLGQCTTKGTVKSPGYVLGDSAWVYFAMDNGATIGLNAAVDPSGQLLVANFAGSGACGLSQELLARETSQD